MIDFYVTYLLTTNVYQLDEYTWVYGHVTVDSFCVYAESFESNVHFQSQVRQRQVPQGDMRSFMTWIISLFSQVINHQSSHQCDHIHVHETTISFSSQILSHPSVHQVMLIPGSNIKWCLPLLHCSHFSSTWPLYVLSQTFKPFLNQFCILSVSWHAPMR